MAQHEIDPDRRPYDPARQAAKEEIDAADFFALDLRVGRVVTAAPFPDARKPAYRLLVDFGPVIGRLETSAQITNYTTDELEGRLVVGAVNLPPKRIAGFASEFLVLGGLEPDGTVRLLAPDAELAPGSVVA